MRVDEVTRVKLGQTDNSRALSFIDELEGMAEVHPFNPDQRIIGGAAIHISPTRRNRVHVHDVLSLEPNKGHATRMVRLLQKLAKKHNVAIELFAKAYSNSPNHITDTERLVQWYEKLGFHKDEDMDEIDIDDGVEMSYYPE